MDQYYLKDKKILIYGAGTGGSVLYDVLCKETNVEGFVDLRGASISCFCGMPVYTLQQLEEQIEKKEEYIIIITVRNVFSHTEIAKQLRSIGFMNIIYKPWSVLNGIKDEILQRINEAYEELTVKFCIPVQKIPQSIEEVTFVLRDEGLFKEEDYYYTVFLPAENFFTNVINDKKWSDLHFLSEFPTVKFYRYMCGTKDYTYEEMLKIYINTFSKEIANNFGIMTDKKWEMMTLEGRMKVFDEMNQKLSLDPHFLIKNCTYVEYVGKQKFRLIKSGKNRVSFMIAKGFRYIPAKISKIEYENYLNKEVAIEIVDMLQQRGKAFCSIPHPFFYKYPVENANYFQEWIERVIYYLVQEIYDEKGKFSCKDYLVYDVGQDDGCAARCLLTVGFDVICESETELKQKLDQLFGFAELDYSKDCGQKIISSILSNKMDMKKYCEVIERTEKNCFVCCWEKGEDIKKIMSAYGFKEVKNIFKIIWNLENVEGILFKR